MTTSIDSTQIYSHNCIRYPTCMSKKLTPAQEEKFHSALLKQLLALATGGFGLAAALAWNDTIKKLIDDYIKKRLPEGEGLGYQLIYALIITLVAVLTTYYLTKAVQRFDKKEDK